MASAVVALELLTRRLEGGMTEEEIISSSKNPESTARFRAGPGKFVHWLAILAVPLWLLLGETQGLFLAGPVLWCSFVVWIFSHPRLGKAVSNSLFRSVALVPPDFISLYLFGYYEGRPDDDTPSATHRLHFASTAGSNSTVDGQLKRAFGQWILIQNEKGNITWISRQEVRRIDLLQEHTPFSGALCWFWDLPRCGQAP